MGVSTHGKNEKIISRRGRLSSSRAIIAYALPEPNLAVFQRRIGPPINQPTDPDFYSAHVLLCPVCHETRAALRQGGSAQTDMEALERQADKIRAAKAQGAAASAGAEANPEEIDLNMDGEVRRREKRKRKAPSGVAGYIIDALAVVAAVVLWICWVWERWGKERLGSYRRRCGVCSTKKPIFSIILLLQLWQAGFKLCVCCVCCASVPCKCVYRCAYVGGGE